MILDETRMASAVLDGEEEATTPEAPEAPAAVLDGEEEGTPAEGGDDAPVAQLDGEEEGGDSPAMPSEEGEGESTETPAPDQGAGV